MLLLFINDIDYGRNTEGRFCFNVLVIDNVMSISGDAWCLPESHKICRQEKKVTKYVDKRGLPLACELRGIPHNFTPWRKPHFDKCNVCLRGWNPSEITVIYLSNYSCGAPFIFVCQLCASLALPWFHSLSEWDWWEGEVAWEEVTETVLRAEAREARLQWLPFVPGTHEGQYGQ